MFVCPVVFSSTRRHSLKGNELNCLQSDMVNHQIPDTISLNTILHTYLRHKIIESLTLLLCKSLFYITTFLHFNFNAIILYKIFIIKLLLYEVLFLCIYGRGSENGRNFPILVTCERVVRMIEFNLISIASDLRSNYCWLITGKFRSVNWTCRHTSDRRTDKFKSLEKFMLSRLV